MPRTVIDVGPVRLGREIVVGGAIGPKAHAGCEAFARVAWFFDLFALLVWY